MGGVLSDVLTIIEGDEGGVLPFLRQLFQQSVQLGVGAEQLAFLQGQIVALMDLKAVEIRVPGGVGDLRGGDGGQRFSHGLRNRCDLRLRVYVHHGGDALGNSLAGDDHHVFLRQALTLLGSHDDVAVVGQDEHGLGGDLIDSGHAYVAKNGDVYFRVKSDPEYGKLSHLKLDDLESGNRELRSQMEDDLKEDPADFAVWKAAKPGEPAWESPYGMGRPGWHIECSAMSRTHLGKTIDLHCGGQDLIFPHHENEIAQSECANGCTFARYWMHNGFINVDNQKMSKSLHNFFTVRDVANIYGYEPIRYFMLTAGYRMPLNYTVDLIESCKNSLERLYTCRENLDFTLSKGNFGTDEALKEKAAEARTKFCTAMDDDLNTPDALAAVFDLVKDINTLSAVSSKDALQTAAAAFDEITNVLGLLYNRKKDEVPAEVTELVEKRAAAKKAKDWATADAIRAQLTEMGWAVKDTAQGPQLSKL